MLPKPVSSRHKHLAQSLEVLAARELLDSEGDVGVASQEPMKQGTWRGWGWGWEWAQIF